MTQTGLYSVEFHKRLRKLISDCNDIVVIYKAGEYTMQEAIGELRALEDKAFGEDPLAEPDGDYTYTVAMAMDEIERLDEIDRPKRVAKEIADNLKAMMSLADVVATNTDPIDITWKDKDGMNKTYSVKNNINLAKFILDESRDLRHLLEETNKRITSNNG